MTDQSNTPQSQTYPPSAEVVKNAHIDAARYEEMYAASVADPEAFWAEHGKRIDWIKPFSTVKNTDFTLGKVDIKWFEDGTLNVAANCVDRHLETRGDQTAIIWEPDDPQDKAKHITYRELHRSVCKMANILETLGVRRGDRVVVKRKSGEIMAKILLRQSVRKVDLKSLNPDHDNCSLDIEDVEWVARIVWVSQ